MNKTFWAIIAVIIITFGAIVVINKGKDADMADSSLVSQHITGQGASGVKLVEYGDYQCPYCGQFHPIVKQVVAKYQDKIQFQFRNLPLIQVHPNAFAASRAAEAADMQGKFWEMYDMIFQNQSTWSDSSNVNKVFEGYAKQLDMDVDKFKKDAASSKVNSIINADIAEFKKTKQDLSTPTFFLDGKKIQARSVDEFSKLIDEAIAKAEKNQEQSQ